MSGARVVGDARLAALGAQGELAQHGDTKTRTTSTGLRRGERCRSVKGVGEWYRSGKRTGRGGSVAVCIYKLRR